MLGQAPTGGAAVGKDHPDADHQRAPSPRPSDFRGEAPVSVGLPEEAADVGKLGLDLDDQHRPVARVPSDEVDRSPLAIDRKRDLGFEDPVGEMSKALGKLILNGGMTSVDQAVDFAALPANDERNARLERAERRSQHLHRHAAQPSPLDARNERRRHANRRCQPDLGPSAPQSQRLQRRADPEVVHARSLATAAYPGLTGGPV